MNWWICSDEAGPVSLLCTFWGSLKLPSPLTSLSWYQSGGVPARMPLITVPSPLPSISPPGNRGILRYETSVFPPALPSPQPGTMRTKDKNFHYLAPLLGVFSFSFSLLSLYSHLPPPPLNALSLYTPKPFQTKGADQPAGCDHLFVFVSWFSIPFLSQAKQKERAQKPFPLSLTSLLPLISIHQFSAECWKSECDNCAQNGQLPCLFAFEIRSIVWCGEW